jgi:hypothetical protein
MMMGLCMKVFVSVSLFLINLVGEGDIREVRDENIQKGEGIFLFHFHSESYIGGNVVKWLKKEVSEE